MQQTIKNHKTVGSQTDVVQKEIAQLTEELQKQRKENRNCRRDK